MYETLLWDSGKIRNWPEHRDRLAVGCSYVGIKPAEWLKMFNSERLETLLQKNGLHETRARIRLMVFAKPFVGETNSYSHLAVAGPAAPLEIAPCFTCAVSSSIRASDDVSYNHKLLGRLQADQDLRIAGARGYNDVLYFNETGEVCEASYSNFWLIKDNSVHTSPFTAPCLPGIIRDKILAVATEIGCAAYANDPITRDRIISADEIFLSSSIRGLCRVTAVDGIWSAKSNIESSLLSDLRLLAMG